MYGKNIGKNISFTMVYWHKLNGIKYVNLGSFTIEFRVNIIHCFGAY